jgi:hypothetical protein
MPVAVNSLVMQAYITRVILDLREWIIIKIEGPRLYAGE